MKRWIVVLTLAFAASLLSAAATKEEAASAPTPESGWKKEIVASLAASQTEFDNWAQGGEDCFSWQSGLRSRFTRDRAKTAWANSLDLAYGRTRIEGSPSRKTTDELKAESLLTYKMGRTLNPFMAFSGRTQMTAGYVSVAGLDVQTSTFLDPGYFMESAGLGYSKGDSFSTRLGAALKQTITRDYPGWADDPSTAAVEKTRSEAGLTSVTELKKKMGSASLFTSKLDLFSNLEGTREVDVRWDNILSTKVTKLLTFGAEFDLAYDRDISLKRQLKQLLNLGFSYSLL